MQRRISWRPTPPQNFLFKFTTESSSRCRCLFHNWYQRRGGGAIWPTSASIWNKFLIYLEFYLHVVATSVKYVLIVLTTAVQFSPDVCCVFVMPSPLIGGVLSDDAVWRLTSVCRLSVSRHSVAYIGPKSRTDIYTETKIGTEVAHVTCDSGITFNVKGQRSRSPGRFAYCGVYASGSCSGGRGNVFTVGTYCYVAVRRGRLGGARRFGAHRRRRGTGHIVAAARLQLVNCLAWMNSAKEGRFWSIRLARFTAGHTA